MSKPSRHSFVQGCPMETSSKRHSTMIIRFLRASMAFAYHRFFTSKFFSNLIFRIGLVLTFCLWRRRRRRPGQDDGAESSSDDTVLIMDGSCPMLVPVHVVTSMIKSRIPIIEFGEYVEGRRRRGLNNNSGEEREDPSRCCAVCMGTIECGHFIREPSNCDHVFHGECLDRWIGEHRLTCPLCRCIMLPARRNITFC